MDNYISVGSLQNYQKLEEYQKTMDTLNEHSAQMQQILRAMEDEEERKTP